jgi:uncharacterized repeat protein (TIGR01451 family)
MFRKLVSNLSFSPALITQVSFYAHRLRQEEITRRLTVVFVVLALIVQSLAVFAPPESANASSEQDLIRGGVQDMDDLLVRYDKNTDDIKDIYSAFGINRDELVAAKPGSFNSKDKIYSVSRYGQYSPEQGETSFSYKRSEGGIGIRYVSPLSLADTSSAKQRAGTIYDGWIGQSAKLGWFAIIKANAGIATKGYPSTIVPDSVNSTSTATKTITAINLTEGAAANEKTANPFDKISYTLTVQNNGPSAIREPLVANLTDSLEYASLIDDGGGTIDASARTITWPAVSIGAGKSEERTFVLQLISPIPSTPTGKSNGSSFDCIMSMTFGTNIQVPVNCPTVKGVESVIGDLPPAGIIANVVFSVVLFATVIYFYARTRQMKKEIRLIRHSVNTGTM